MPMYLTQSLHRALQRCPDRVATIFGIPPSPANRASRTPFCRLASTHTIASSFCSSAAERVELGDEGD